MNNKKLYYALLLAFIGSSTAFSQVGIGTTDPKATLDVVGKPTDANALDGIILPRLTGDQLQAKTYTAAQTGAKVYVTAAATAPAGQTVNVTVAGEYVFNGTAWVQGPAGATGPAGPAGPAGSNATVTGTAPIAVAAGVVSLNDLGVTTIKMADNAITSAKILDGTIATVDIANNAVTVAKLPTGATATTFLRGDGTWVVPANTTYTAGTGLTLTGSSFSANDATTTTNGIVRLAGDLTGTAAAPTVATGAITSAKILDSTIATTDIANNAVTVAKLPTGATATTFLRGDGAWVVPTDLNNNIYNTNGTLTGARTLTQGANSLTFTGNGNFIKMGGLVGIDIATPSEKLDVQGNIRVSGGGGVFIVTNEYGMFTRPSTLVMRGSNTGGIAFDVQNTTDAMNIAWNGNVGIGTNAPAAKLNVIGDIKAHNGIFTFSSEYGMFTRANTLVLRGSNNDGIEFDVKSTTGAMAIAWNGNVGIGTTAPTARFDVNSPIGAGDSYSSIALRTANYGYFIEGGITQGVGGTLVFKRNSNGSIVETVRFTNNGNVGIGTATPGAKLHVIGNVIATGGYADYVLEEYVDGASVLNANYNRKSLTEVDAFIKTNKHLPGVTAVKDLKIASNGEYEIDITKLQVQLLEKVEELYLHTIEQQKQIDALKAELAKK